MTYSDQDIIQKIRSGNPREERDALQCMRRQCFPLIWQYVCKKGGSFQDGQDIYAEVEANLLKKTRTSDFKLTCALKTYNFSVAQNLWNKRLRKKSRISRIGDWAKLMPANLNIENDLIKRELYKRLNEAVDTLPDREKQVLRLFYFEGKKMTEIAGTLGLGSEQVAKNLKCKAMKKLKNTFRK